MLIAPILNPLVLEIRWENLFTSGLVWPSLNFFNLASTTLGIDQI